MRGNRVIAVAIGLGFVVAFGVVFWATWSALPPHRAVGTPPPGKVVAVEVISVLCWAITGAYGAALAALGGPAKPSSPSWLCGRSSPSPPIAPSTASRWRSGSLAWARRSRSYSYGGGPTSRPEPNG
jgi:hypothetical protein